MAWRILANLLAGLQLFHLLIDIGKVFPHTVYTHPIYFTSIFIFAIQIHVYYQIIWLYILHL